MQGWTQAGYHFESGPSLYSGMASSGKEGNPLAHVLQAIEEPLDLIEYDDWNVLLPEGEFLTRVGGSNFEAVLSEVCCHLKNRARCACHFKTKSNICLPQQTATRPPSNSHSSLLPTPTLVSSKLSLPSNWLAPPSLRLFCPRHTTSALPLLCVNVRHLQLLVSDQIPSL